jgi:hypothetical protein
MGIEDLKDIKDLEAFANGLPPKQKVEAYRLAKRFYDYGKGVGMMGGIFEALGPKEQSGRVDRDFSMPSDYFKRKITEATEETLKTPATE